MVARDPNEPHRAATPLELLYDLCYVVAIAQAAASLHHSVSHGHGLEGAGAFALVFFTIWWAWMNFTWFASAFDTDDAVYRVKVLVQMCGVLVLAAGVPRAFEHNDFSLVTIGYVIMRIGLVSQWIRAGLASTRLRATAFRYAIGIVLCQIGWIGLWFAPHGFWLYGFFVLAPLELLVPVWAERRAPTTWHPHHIAERYGLMTIIVIGESVLAATLAVQSAVDEGHLSGRLVTVIAGSPLVFFSMWWLYYAKPQHARLGSVAKAFVWGYAHYLVFAAAAAVGAGLAVAVDHATGHASLSAFGAGEALAAPLAVYLLALWFAQTRGERGCGPETVAYAVTIVLVLASPLVFPTPLAPGVLLAALTAFVVVRG